MNLNNQKYVEYHDKEWGVPLHDDKKLYELFILECFQSGLSWECILNRREAFRQAFDDFDIDRVIQYGEEKIAELLENSSIIRNRKKIEAAIGNSRIIKSIQEEHGSFDSYIWSFTQNKVIFEPCDEKTTSVLSDTVSKDLKKRGVRFAGSITVYSFLQAAGVINGHTKNCKLFCSRGI